MMCMRHCLHASPPPPHTHAQGSMLALGEDAPREGEPSPLAAHDAGAVRNATADVAQVRGGVGRAALADA